MYQSEMSLRMQLAVIAPALTKERLETLMKMEHNRNPHNDSYKPKLHSEAELQCIARFEWADMMIKAEQGKL